MAYDEGIAQRLREVFVEQGMADERIVEKRMFGGLAMMVSGHMCCGIVNDTLMVRVGPKQYAQALGQPHAREMDFTGKPLNGFVYVAPPGFESDQDLSEWVSRGLEFVATLPARA